MPKLQAEKMLSYARKFVLVERNRNLPDAQAEVAIEWRNVDAWAIVIDRMDVLNKNGELEYEPMPSGRTNEFKERTRYSFEEAWEVAEKFIADERHKHLL